MLRSVGVSGFDHTRVYVSDMERSREFYERVLDLQVYRESKLQGVEGIEQIYGQPGAAVHLVFGRIAGHTVELIKRLDCELDRPPENYVGGSGFTVTVVDVEAAYKAAIESNVDITTELVDIGGTRIFFIRDPDGARIELIEYADKHHVVWPGEGPID